MQIPPPFYITSFEEVEAGHIVGIVDSYGAVHSKFTGEDMGYHEEFWPNQTHCTWRWCRSQGIYSTIVTRRPDIEQGDAIIRHLERKYRMKFFENGYHDYEDLEKRRDKIQKSLDKKNKSVNLKKS